MTTIGRAAPFASVVLLAGLALSGCGAKGTDAEAKSTTPSAAETTSSAAPTTSAAKPTGDKVGPADLPAIVANRTYRGESEGMPYAEYYGPDGSLRGKSGAEAYAGSWKVVGEQLCFTYPEAGSDSETECYAVFKNGDTISWVDSEGKIVEATYVEGNPDNL